MNEVKSKLPRQDPKLQRAAADWAVRLREEDIAQEDFAEWLDWYESDPRHKAAYDDMQSFLGQLDPVVEGDGAIEPKFWLTEAKPHERKTVSSPPVRRTAQRRRRRWAAAAAVTLLGIAALFWTQGQPDSALATLSGSSAPAQSFVALEHNTEATLADGSRMELANRTQVSVELTEHQRTVTMQDGAAYFTVAHNSQRPFVVKVGAFNVRAVGTAFNVRSSGPRMVVTVAEGTVEVYGRNREASVLARAGTEIAWSIEGGSPMVTAVDPAHALAWKEGRLDYFKEPLGSVVADINRYSRIPVRVRGSLVGELAVTGTIRTDGIEEWLRALPAMFPLTVEEVDGGIVLSSRSDR